MLNIYIGNSNLYYLLCYFLIFSFLGWLMETVRVSLREKRYVNRGFAKGPYCPIYGFGMSFVIVFLSGIKDNIPLLFVCGMALTTALEYFTAYLLETIFNATWWDYSYKKFNIKGRICLDISLAWGVLSVIMIELVVPFLKKIIDKIPPIIGQVVVVILVAVLLVDAVMTANSIFSFKKVVVGLNAIKNDIKLELEEFSDKFSDNLGEYVDFSELRAKVKELNVKTDDLKKKLDEKRKLFEDYTREELKKYFEGKDFSEEKLAAINRIREKYARYEAIKRVKISNTHKRILAAYPGFKPKNKEFHEIVKKIRERFKG